MCCGPPLWGTFPWPNSAGKSHWTPPWGWGLGLTCPRSLTPRAFHGTIALIQVHGPSHPSGVPPCACTLTVHPCPPPRSVQWLSTRHWWSGVSRGALSNRMHMAGCALWACTFPPWSDASLDNLRTEFHFLKTFEKGGICAACPSWTFMYF